MKIYALDSKKKKREKYIQKKRKRTYRSQKNEN